MNICVLYGEKVNIYKEAEDLGHTRHNLSELTKSGQLKRLRLGLYQLKGKVIDDFVLISSNSNRIIFFHQTARINEM